MPAQPRRTHLVEGCQQYDQNKIGAEGHFKDELVVIDRHIITSRGPATAYAFAYALVDYLGYDAKAVQERMLYDAAFPNREDLKHA